MNTNKSNNKKSRANPPKARTPRRRRTRRARKSGGLGRAPPNKNLTRLLPSGVNNKATVPRYEQRDRIVGNEAIATIVIPRTAIAGDKVYNEQISHETVKRLQIASRMFQHVKWNKCQFKVVALNGTKVSNGYTAAFIEDPELDVPVSSADTIAFLTTLRGTEINQNWCQSVVGQVAGQSLPKMYTQKGSDLRRFFIGRMIIAANGPPGDEPVVFQLMMHYDVELMIPCIRPDITTTGFKLAVDVVAGAIRMTGTGLKTELPAIPMQYTGSLPPPGIYEVPNATIPLRRQQTTFGWNENDEETNVLFYRDWPADLYENSNNYDLNYLVVPNGATSIQDCGFKSTLTSDTILFSSLSDISAEVVVTTADEDIEGIDVTIPEGYSWLTQEVAFDNVNFANADNGKLPLHFGSNFLQDKRPLIKAGTTLIQIGPAPTLAEMRLEQLTHRYNTMVSKLGKLLN
jgi:hypothetical protein